MVTSVSARLDSRLTQTQAICRAPDAALEASQAVCRAVLPGRSVQHRRQRYRRVGALHESSSQPQREHRRPVCQVSGRTAHSSGGRPQRVAGTNFLDEGLN